MVTKSFFFFCVFLTIGISHQDPISEREHRRMTMNVHFDDDDDEFQSDESDEDVFPRIRQDRLSAQQRRWQSTQDSEDFQDTNRLADINKSARNNQRSRAATRSSQSSSGRRRSSSRSSVATNSNKTNTPSSYSPADKCNMEKCRLPDCFCGGNNIPGKLPVSSVPQLVLITFDDAVNEENQQLYEDLFQEWENPNGCPITATFFVSHDWTDYVQVRNLYADGHEIASHTISHSFGQEMIPEVWAEEAVGQRDILSAYAGIRPQDIRGLRAPYLAIGGDNMFKMLHDTNFTYDSSMPVMETSPPSWPYTLDYKLPHTCVIPPCPTKSFPGVWEVPMNMWDDLTSGRCSMGDDCKYPEDPYLVKRTLMLNFERHYYTNRAPFPLFFHATWFAKQTYHKDGFKDFIEEILRKDDVWVVTTWQALQWIRNPTPLSRIHNFQPFQCDNTMRRKQCPPEQIRLCKTWHVDNFRYFSICGAVCPDVYPWTGNTGIKNQGLELYLKQ